MLVLHFVALWFILRGDLLYVFPCVIFFLCFSVLLVLRLPPLGKRELILVLFIRCSVCACLDLSVSSSSWSLGRAAVCDCGTPWTFLLAFFLDLPVLVLFFVALWFILRGDLLYIFLCHFGLVFFSPFSIAITSLGEERANLVAFCTFVRLCLFGFVGFLFLLGSGKGCGLWLWHSLGFSLTFFFTYNFSKSVH